MICAKAQEALQHEKRLLIAVPNLEAAQYVDALLWKTPEESFIPHVITQAATSEWIAITTQQHLNVNQATCLLNLCTPPSLLYQQMDEIYDLYDETHSQKIELSQQRMHFYQTKNLLVKVEGS